MSETSRTPAEEAAFVLNLTPDQENRLLADPYTRRLGHISVETSVNKVQDQTPVITRV